MGTINLADAKADLSELVHRVQAGDTISLPGAADRWRSSPRSRGRVSASIWPCWRR
jgi:antitoxin (DNA-binding transcriptional repressor) of toxin-antitoxin stability system